MDGLIAYALAKKYADKVGRSIVDASFKTQVEQDRSILQTTGQEKILYFIPKTTAKPSDGYDEYVYSNNAWEQVGATDVDLSSYATKAEVGNLNNLPTTDKSSIVSAISETFTSVSNGKSLVASAITDKGVSTSSDATFEIMAQNIEAIPIGSDFDMTVTNNQVKMLVYITPEIMNCYVNYIQTVANGVEVDWGDGTQIDTSNLIGDNRNTCAYIYHEYSKNGFKIITLTAKQGTVKTLSNNGFLSFAGERGTTNGGQFPNNYYRRALIGIAFGDSTFGGVDECDGVIFINNAYDSTLYNHNLQIVTIRNGVKVFRGVTTSAIQNIKIPNSVRRFDTNCFRTCTFLKLVDFTDFTIDELSQCIFGSTLFNGSTDNGLTILFKDQETAEYAKTITNLSVWANYVKYVGEV